ncbi:hypothetical protein HDV06_002825 [Boothiomyces sp. JEL0866]|nr:hypothetical protein HDV06_002825 [Boothiomyces sp. JEL0866]
MSEEHLQSIENSLVKRDGCYYSQVWGMNICLNYDDMIALGRVVGEPCNWNNNGQQKCVGDKGFVTCDNGAWTIRQPCGSGTRCQPYPTDPNNHVLCGW